MPSDIAYEISKYLTHQDYINLRKIVHISQDPLNEIIMFFQGWNYAKPSRTMRDKVRFYLKDRGFMFQRQPLSFTVTNSKHYAWSGRTYRIDKTIKDFHPEGELELINAAKDGDILLFKLLLRSGINVGARNTVSCFSTPMLYYTKWICS